MISLSENQRGLALTISGALILVAALDIPTGLAEPYASYLRYGIGIAGVVGFGLQKFLQEQVTGPTQFSKVNPISDLFMQATTEDQKKILALLDGIMAAGISATPTPEPPK